MSKKKLLTVNVNGPFNVTIDYKKSLKQMIVTRSYDYVNGNIVGKNFPLQGVGIVEAPVMLVHFGCCISSNSAIKKLDKLGFAPTKIEHLVGLGAQHPDLQKLFPIVCLGDFLWLPSSGVRAVPCLDSWPSGRNRSLNLVLYDNKWHDLCRFAVMCK